MQREIEVKAKINDIKVMKSRVENLGCTFTEPVTQEDKIFINFAGDFVHPPHGVNFLRVRRSNGKSLFTLKQDRSNELDCIEKETEVVNPEQLVEALVLMGYHEVVRVKKSRIKTKYRDLEICLDEVEDLGMFIEIEKKSNEDGEKVQNELAEFLYTLGVEKEDRITYGYDTLLYLKTHEDKV